MKAEINNVHLLFRLVRATQYVTVLSEQGLRAIPIEAPGQAADGCPQEKYDMVGCIHTLKGAYLKSSAREFIKMLGQSIGLSERTRLANLIRP